MDSEASARRLTPHMAMAGCASYPLVQAGPTG
jgi:hypothetical protein